MSIISEFKQFIQRGNVMDLAVGVIIGAAFGKIVNSLVSDVIMPPISLVIGQVPVKLLSWNLAAAKVVEITDPFTKEVKKAQLDPVTLNYGTFLQNVLDFLIVGFCVFLMVKAMNTLQRKKEEAPKPAELSTTEKLLTEIRDALQAK